MRMPDAKPFLVSIHFVVVLAVTACSGSGNSNTSDGTAAVTNMNPVLNEFLPLCTTPKIAATMNSSDIELNHYHYENRRFITAFNLEQSFIYFELDTVSGTASPVEETPWLNYLNTFGQAERIGSNYVFKGYSSIESSGIFVYDPANGTQRDIAHPVNGEIVSLGESLVVGTQMYLSADFNQLEPTNSVTQSDLWRFDPSTDTLRLFDISPDPDLSSSPQNLMQIGSTVIFEASTNDVLNDLYVLDTNTDVFFKLSERNSIFIEPRDAIIVDNKIYFQAYINEERMRRDLFEYDPLTEQLKNITANLSDQTVQIIGGFIGFRTDGQHLYWVRASNRSGFGPRVFRLELSTLQITDYNLIGITLGAIREFAVSDNKLIAMLQADVISDATGESSLDYPDVAVLDLVSAEFQMFDLLANNDGQANGLELYDGKFYFSAGTPFTDELGFTDNRYNLWRMDLGCS